MTEQDTISIADEAEFLAHVIALKNESEERLQVMADCLSEHNNPNAAGVFTELAQFIAGTIGQLEDKAREHHLPEIPPWEYQWHCATDPEAICMDHAHYLMSVREALELALFNEKRSMEFFQRIEQDVTHPEVVELAREQLMIEKEFADLIQQRLMGLAEEDLVCEDLDPPNIPE